jgi:hypothetical protein
MTEGNDEKPQDTRLRREILILSRSANYYIATLLAVCGNITSSVPIDCHVYVNKEGPLITVKYDRALRHGDCINSAHI